MSPLNDWIVLGLLGVCALMILLLIIFAIIADDDDDDDDDGPSAGADSTLAFNTIILPTMTSSIAGISVNL